MADENLDNLPPEERIRKLKEMEKKRKQEIEDAQKKIKESEAELTERFKWKEKVPLPEFAQDDLRGLSEEAREILQHRGVSKKIEKPAEAVPAKEKEKPSLEETVGQDVLSVVPPEIFNAEYTQHLSQQPVHNR